MPEPSPTAQDKTPVAVPPPPPAKRLVVVRVLTVAVVVASLAAAWYYRDRIQELQHYGYAAAFMVGLIANATIVLPVPGLAVVFVMGSVFNPWIVGVVGGLGMALGEITGYMIGYSGQTLVDENPTYERLTRWMRRYGVLPIFVLALIPNPVFDLGGIAAGALRLPVWKFLASAAAGTIIKGTVFALAGYYGISALARLVGAGG